MKIYTKDIIASRKSKILTFRSKCQVLGKDGEELGLLYLSFAMKAVPCCFIPFIPAYRPVENTFSHHWPGELMSFALCSLDRSLMLIRRLFHLTELWPLDRKAAHERPRVFPSVDEEFATLLRISGIILLSSLIPCFPSCWRGHVLSFFSDSLMVNDALRV